MTIVASASRWSPRYNPVVVHDRERDLVKRVGEPCLQTVSLKVRCGGTSHADSLLFVKRALGSHARRNIILASVFGTVAFVAILAAIYLLFRYWTRRRELSTDITIEERPPHSEFQDPDPKPVVYQNSPPPVPRPQYTPTRIHNHPYAFHYNRRNSIPPTPTERDAPLPPLTLPLPAFSHPYTQAQPIRESSSHAASTIYESFVAPATPEPEPAIRASSPIASTVGGGYNDHGTSSEDGATMLSRSLSQAQSENSSTPLNMLPRSNTLNRQLRR